MNAEIAPELEDALHEWWVKSTLRSQLQLINMRDGLAEFARLMPQARIEADLRRDQGNSVPADCVLGQLAAVFALRARDLARGLEENNSQEIRAILLLSYDDLLNLDRLDLRWSVVLEKEKLDRLRVRIWGVLFGS